MSNSDNKEKGSLRMVWSEEKECFEEKWVEDEPKLYLETLKMENKDLCEIEDGYTLDKT